MQANQQQPGRIRRTFNDLIMTEMFLVQATIESATVIGEGLNDLGKHLGGEEAERSAPAIGDLLQRTADQAMEPYATRLRYLRKLYRSNP